ncbi:hypothetical protein Tco_0310345, partial [Tanacetum coccineum]
NFEKGNGTKAKGFRTRLGSTLKKSKTSETTSGSTYGGFNLNNEADEFEEEAQEHRSMGRDHSKAKKKSSASSRGGSSSFVDLVVDR